MHNDMKRYLFTLILLCLSTALWAQIDVHGTVTDDKGESVIGASVVIQGTTEGTVTDFDGNFQIRANQGAKLIVSYVGYKSQTITVNDASPLRITLAEDAEMLEEVVAIGYGTVRKSHMTGAISSVKTEEMNMSTSTLEQALIGHTPGVEIKQTSGAPGSGTTIRIRGVNSVNAGVEPLYVVDGFPASKDVYINPSDVENIEVLKDAASAAIYGSRAAGGVVLITTKRGAEGKPRVQLDYQFSMQQLQKKIKMMDAEQFRQLHLDGYNNAYFDYLRQHSEIYGDDDAVNWQHSREDDNATRTTNGAGNTMLLCPDVLYTPYNTDWQDEIFSNAPMHKVNFSVSGGKDKSKYMFSLGYINQDGIIAPSNHQRITTRLNLDFNATDRFSIGVNSNMYYVKERKVRTDGLAFSDGLILNVLGMPPTYPVYEEDGSYAVGWSYRNNRDYTCFGGENPVALAYGLEDNYNKIRASLNTNLRYKIIDGMFAKVNAGVQIADQIRDFYRPSWLGQSNYEPGDWETNDLVKSRNDRDFNIDWLLEATLSYDKTFADKHTISAVAGYSMEYKYYNNVDVATILGALPDDRIHEVSAAQPTLTDENGTAAKTDKIAWALMSVFGRAMYNYDNRYTLSVTLRGDGCSRFGPSHRWGLFPSVSAGWNITNEHFAEDIQDKFTAKLRASWGISGNNNISNYRHIPVIKEDSYVFGSSAVLAYYPSSADTDLGWEKTSQVNVGTDLAFWSGRLSLVLNYYYSNTTDLLYLMTTSAVTGATSMWTNLHDGHVINQGGDIQVDANVLNISGVKWNIGFNVSINRNNVYGLPNEIIEKAQRKQITHITKNGHPIGSYYGMVSEGLITPEDYALIQEDAKHVGEPGYVLKGPAVANYAEVYIGDVKWRDVDGDGQIISEKDRDIIGDNYPKFSYGFNTSLSWKGLSLSATFDGQYGNKVINFSRYYIANNEGGCNTMAVGLNRYQGEYTQPYETNPDMMFRANRSQKNSNTQFSSYFVEDGSFLRMTNLTLGYTIPDNKAFKTIGLSKFYIYFSVDNVFTATKYTGYNPDVDYNASNTAPGIDFGTYPLARSFSGGVKLTF